ncbi:MAG: ABC transporter substrate-binding protein [Anaerolineae bacterium]
MFLNSVYLSGRSGISRLMFTSLIVLVLFITAFGITAQENPPLRLGLEPPINLDPATGVSDQEVLFSRLIYDYLIDLSADNELIPQLAESWTISEDGLAYTFDLREGVTFHDGSEFTAADVVYTFNRIANPDVGSSAVNLLGEYEVTAVDDYTVAFTLPQPNADFLFGVASRFALILPEGQETPNVLQEGSDAPYANFNGTGPYELAEYNIGENAVFTANEDYWAEGQPVLDTIEMIFIEDKTAQINALRTGTVDAIFRIPIDQIPVLEGEENITILQEQGSTHPVVRLNASEGGLGEDVRVRQAFKLATDRELLNLDVFDGLATVGNNDPIAPVYGQFFTPIADEYDPARACELLAEAGYVDANGEPRLETTFHVDDTFNYAVLATAMAAQWEEGCIYADLNVQSPNLYYSSDNPDNWLAVDLGLTAWGSRPTPQQFLTEAYVTGASFNESRWSNAALDELVTQASQTADLEERAALYAEISQIFAEEGPIIIPVFIPVFGAVNDRVEGLRMHPFSGRTDLRNVSLNS